MFFFGVMRSSIHIHEVGKGCRNLNEVESGGTVRLSVFNEIANGFFNLIWEKMDGFALFSKSIEVILVYKYWPLFPAARTAANVHIE